MTEFEASPIVALRPGPAGLRKEVHAVADHEPASLVEPVRQAQNLAVPGAPGPWHRRRHRIAFDFVLPASPAMKSLRSWRAALAGNADPKNVCAGTDDGSVPPQAVAWLREVLHVFDLLLLNGRVPLFGSCRLLLCQPPAGPGVDAAARWHACVELPFLEGLAPGAFSVALQAAFALEEWTRRHADRSPTDAAACEAFFALAEQQALVPLRSLLPQGKSTFPVLHAAFELGIPFSPLGGGAYQLGWGAQARRISRSSTDGDSAIGAALTQRKDVTARLLRSAGLPAPVHVLVNTLDGARSAAQTLRWPVVVKPVDADRGEGVRVDVQAGDLDAAFGHAQKSSVSARVLVEQQVQGTCHRVFVSQGQLLYAVKRLPIGMDGDGQLSVARLVEKARASQRLLPPWKCVTLPPLDELSMAALQSQDMHGEVVPDAGQFVALRRIESTAWGGVDEDVTATIHPENVRVAVAASALCGLDVAGVDIISPDITLPWHRNGAVINEVNFAPFLGEGLISQLHVQTFLSRLLKGNGRIPVEVYVGDAAAVAAARKGAAKWRAAGMATVLTTHEWTETPDAQAWPLAVEGLHARVRALVLSPQVGALVIVVQTDELLDRDLPLEGVDAVHMVNEKVVSCQPPAMLQRRADLLQLLRAWVWPGAAS